MPCRAKRRSAARTRRSALADGDGGVGGGHGAQPAMSARRVGTTGHGGAGRVTPMRSSARSAAASSDGVGRGRLGRRGCRRPWRAARRRTGRAPRGRSRRRRRPRRRSCGRCRSTGSWRRPAVELSVDGEREDLGGQRQLRGEDGVVEDLGLLAGAEWPEVEHRVAEGREHGPAPVDDLGRAADHDEQLPVGGLVPAAADGRVEHVEVREVLLEPQQVVGCTVLWTMTIEPSAIAASAPSGPRRTSSTPASSTTQTPRTSDAAPSSAGRRRDRRRGVPEGLERLRAPGPQGGREPGVDDAAGHRSALAAEADEADAVRAVGAHDGSRPASRAAATRRSSRRRPSVQPR